MTTLSSKSTGGLSRVPSQLVDDGGHVTPGAASPPHSRPVASSFSTRCLLILDPSPPHSRPVASSLSTGRLLTPDRSSPHFRPAVSSLPTGRFPTPKRVGRLNSGGPCACRAPKAHDLFVHPLDQARPSGERLALRKSGAQQRLGPAQQRHPSGNVYPAATAFERPHERLCAVLHGGHPPQWPGQRRERRAKARQVSLRVAHHRRVDP